MCQITIERRDPENSLDENWMKSLSHCDLNRESISSKLRNRPRNLTDQSQGSNLLVVEDRLQTKLVKGFHVLRSTHNFGQAIDDSSRRTRPS